MTPHERQNEPIEEVVSVADWLDKPVRITREGVFFGDTLLPGVIAQDGITVRYDKDSFNRLTIEFLVGEVIVDDPAVVENDGQFSIEPEDDDPEPRFVHGGVENPYADLKCSALGKGPFGRKDICEREWKHKGDHRADGWIWANAREGAYE
ncbi:hypothetical protein [Mycolicibacterium septicum]|uniref:hypothetical protein n=1 Tax=Mycolicibacterium septicum TaxID=98668 RepID=UPI001AFA10C0|nr:hypothetical protein [Mycolicibacterium septicum]QRY51751.1 hypothetical protein JVX95_30995 [Mycolicibacterium septicum]